MSIGCEGPRQEDRKRIDIGPCVCIVATSRLQVPILGAILGGILACNVGIIAAAGRAAYCTAPFAFLLLVSTCRVNERGAFGLTCGSGAICRCRSVHWTLELARGTLSYRDLKSGFEDGDLATISHQGGFIRLIIEI